MEKQKANQQITAQLVKSNASENLVWEISVTNSRRKKHYCKNARKTLSFLFIFKKQTGIEISHETIRHLKAIIAKQRNTANETPVEAQ